MGEAMIAIDRQLLPLLPLAVGPNHRKAIDFLRFSQAEDVASIARRGVAAAARGEARLLSPAAFQNQLRAHYIRVVSPRQFDAQPVMVRRRLVVQQDHRLVEMADDEIDTAVVIEVAEGRAASRVRRAEIGAAPMRDVRERATLVA